MNLTNAHLRIARPTDKLAEVVKFYKDGLDFEVLYQFTDHDGFDGVMYKPIRSFNPYWDQRGKTFEDPDGYRVVLQNASWPP